MTSVDELIITPDEQVPDVEADKPEYECALCGRASKSPAGLASHMRHCKGAEPKVEVLPKGAPVPQTPKQKKPALPAGKRQDASNVLGFLYGTASNFVPSVPAQRAMQWQLPSAGRILDDAVAGTFLDKLVIQRIAGASTKIEPLFNLVALPFIAFAIDKQPAMAPMLYPVIRRVMEGNLKSILVQMKRDKDERENLEQLAAAAGMEWNTTTKDPEGKIVQIDIIDSILQGMFAPTEQPVAADA